MTVRSTRVLFITSKGCERCEKELARLRKPGGEFDIMKSLGWKIGEEPSNHIQIIDRDEIPEIVQKLKVREYPTVACIENAEIVRSFKDGCTTPLDSWTFGWLISVKKRTACWIDPRDCPRGNDGQLSSSRKSLDVGR